MNAADLYVTYQFIKRLTTPFDKSKAFELGVIDKDGKKLKEPQSSAERESYGYFDRLVFNIKKLIEKAPGGKSKILTYSAALFLIRESNTIDSVSDLTEEDIAEGILQALEELEMIELNEDIGNSTGSAVAGTGDDSSTVKMDGRNKKIKAFLSRYMKGKEAREETKKIKSKQEFLARLGIVKEL